MALWTECLWPSHSIYSKLKSVKWRKQKKNKEHNFSQTWWVCFFILLFSSVLDVFSFRDNRPAWLQFGDLPFHTYFLQEKLSLMFSMQWKYERRQTSIYRMNRNTELNKKEHSYYLSHSSLVHIDSILVALLIWIILQMKSK